jgi:hypothetical protein
MLGSMLDIKPILLGHMDETGPVAKMRHFDAAVETMLANATRAVQDGLLAPAICIGYGGDPAEVREMPGFPRLNVAADKAGVAVHIAPMSITGGVHAGPGCLTVAFVSDKHTFEEKVFLEESEGNEVAFFSHGSSFPRNQFDFGVFVSQNKTAPKGS